MTEQPLSWTESQTRIVQGHGGVYTHRRTTVAQQFYTLPGTCSGRTTRTTHMTSAPAPRFDAHMLWRTIRGRPASFTLFQFSYYLVRESGPYGLLFNGPLLQAQMIFFSFVTSYVYLAQRRIDPLVGFFSFVFFQFFISIFSCCRQYQLKLHVSTAYSFPFICPKFKFLEFLLPKKFIVLNHKGQNSFLVKLDLVLMKLKHISH